MSDELTPEERDALNSLPRERMPSAALEERVVGAMRGRGMLAPARRARVIRITPARVAGLLAACFALMIGAYSIGVQRGAFRPEVRATLEPRTAGRVVTDETSPATPPAPRPETGLAMQSRPETAMKEEAPAEAEGKLEDAGSASEVARSEERTRALESVGRDEPAPAQQPARELDATMAKKSAPVPSSVPQATDLRAWKTKSNEREYRLGSYLFMVDAPDSVRIVEDTAGRTLLIYTSDGLIRLRLPD